MACFCYGQIVLKIKEAYIITLYKTWSERHSDLMKTEHNVKQDYY